MAEANWKEIGKVELFIAIGEQATEPEVQPYPMTYKVMIAAPSSGPSKEELIGALAVGIGMSYAIAHSRR